MNSYEMFSVEMVGHVAKVLLNRPKKLNALGKAFWEESCRIFAELSADRNVRAVVLAGSGGCFSSGLDLTEVALMCPAAAQGNAGAAARTAVKRFIQDGQRAASAPEECAKPVIAAVHGHCIGAGLDLAAACDVRLCSKDAVFSLREARMGIVADVGVLQRLPRIVGQGWTRQMAYTGEDVDADTALRIGLVNAVYEDRERLMDKAMELARRMGMRAIAVLTGLMPEEELRRRGAQWVIESIAQLPPLLERILKDP